MSMDKAYDPKKYEDEISARWEQSGFYNPDNLPGNRTEVFSIMLPPPNATGTLHLGHAMYVIQDIMIRHARMQGKKTLWLPGTDHAAIATSSKVEALLYKEEGKTRHDLGRASFVRRVEEYVEESKATIRNQLRRMGFSLDWSRERFTLEPKLVAAVQEMFVRMFADGLIYRGDRMVNWDPVMQTTVADDEVNYQEEHAPLYYLQYGPFVIATARPETKFGDKVVVVHPDDERYTKYKNGETLEVEWMNGKVTATIVKDDSIDREFGSGAMTITPWHDAHDFYIAERHGLDRTQIIDLNGRMLPIAGKEFAGLPMVEAREKVVEKLQSKGLVVKVDENYIHNIATNYRGDGVIEPQIMRQWFVAVDKPVVEWKGERRSLKDIAIDVVKSGDITIVPDHFNKTYFHWMENLHDWCISRQLWYGHRIPAWYRNDDTEKMHPVVQINSPSTEFVQDDDVLDTWFSSGMWTFSTLGWPEQTQDLRTYHPTSVLETGYDILFFWVARMILMTTYGMKEIPFKKVYLHGLVRDRQGRKMSKSLDNGIDPLEMSAKYGTDAVRLSLVIGTTPGNDARLYEEKIAGFRNFVNKLWNVARFIKISASPVSDTGDADIYSIADQWILSRLQHCITEVTQQYERDQYGQAGDLLYHFVWHEFADWYIELQKTDVANTRIQREVLATLLRLLHPMIPFVTEALSTEVFGEKHLLMVTSWPRGDKKNINPNVESRMKVVQDLIQKIRSVRTDYRIDAATVIPMIAQTDLAALFPEARLIIERLGRVVFGKATHENGMTIISGDVRCILPLDRLIDVNNERQRIVKEIAKKEQHAAQLAKKLSDKIFVERAPQEIVAQTRALHAATQKELTHLHEALSSLLHD